MSGRVEELVATPADAYCASVLEPAMADARRLVAAAADRQHVGQVDRGLALDDAARALDPARLGVALHHVDALDQHALAVGEHAEDLAGLAALAPRHDHDRVVLANAPDGHLRA